MLPRLARLTRFFALVLPVVFVGACSLREQADAKFGDQHFKTAIALIELYHVRHGAYPDALSDLDFTGDWDQIAINSVEYKRLPTGYELNLTRGWIGRADLTYPPDFWRGLGIRRSNVQGLPPAT